MSIANASEIQAKMTSVKPGQLYEIQPDGRWAMFFDHHSIQTFTDCEQKYKYKMVDKLRRRGGPGYGSAATIGIWWAKALEYFYLGVQDWQTALADPAKPLYPLSSPKYPNKEFILTCAGKAWQDCKMEDWKLADPKGYDKFHGIDGSIQMAGRYYDAQAEYDVNHWHIVGVEHGFGMRREVKVAEDEKVVVYYTGRPDLVVVENKKWMFPVDHKTIDYVKSDTIRKYKPHAQTAGYIISVQELCKSLNWDMVIDRCVINIAARNEPAEKPRNGSTAKPRFTRAYPNYTKDELDEWKNTILLKANRLRQCFETGQWPWRESACHYYSGCEYRGIDSVPPGSRDVVKRADFVQVEPWTPYTVEDED